MDKTIYINFFDGINPTTVTSLLNLQLTLFNSTTRQKSTILFPLMAGTLILVLFSIIFLFHFMEKLKLLCTIQGQLTLLLM